VDSAVVCILGWSRSQYFRFKPESILKSVQEPTKFFRYLISVMMLIVVNRGGARHFHFGGPLEGPVLQQGELSMVCVGLSERDLLPL